MEKILVATDLSVNAKNAAKYGYSLAVDLKANLVLCNAFIVPAELPEAAMIAWPKFEYDELLKVSEKELKALEEALRAIQSSGDFVPEIERINVDGSVLNVIADRVKTMQIDLVIAGAHENTWLNSAIMGNNAHRLIDAATYPLLLVPGVAAYKTIRKLAFATDLIQPKKDLEVIYSLLPLLKQLNAELLITHVYDEGDQSGKFRKGLEGFLSELSNKANYPHIYYRMVKSAKAEKGLNWLCQYGDVDILVMVHREKSILRQVFEGSHTQKMIDSISIPLLVLPDHKLIERTRFWHWFSK